MNSKRLFMTALFVGLFSFGAAQAQGPAGAGQRPPAGPGGGQGGPEQFARLLGLTDAQKAQIKTIHEQAETASKPYHEQLEPLHEQMRTLTHAATFDEAAARALLTKMSQLETELHLIHARTENAIYNLLTPEQKARLDELHKMMEGREQGRPRPNGRP